MTIKRTRQPGSTACRLLIAAFVSVNAAAAADYYLYAAPTSVTVPDGAGGTELVYMWGFGLTDAAFTPVTTTVPGPQLTVAPGDTTLTIHVKNDLPEPISIVIPGQITTMTPQFDPDPDGTGRPRVRSFTHEATAGGGEATYTWTNFKPGTYLYQSGTHPALQVQMGLYGAATRDDGVAGTAYSGVTYAQEFVLVYSEIDPQLHKAVDPSYLALSYEAFGTPDPATMTSTVTYKPKYFLINGQPYQAGTPTLGVTAGNRVLLRLVNAGLRNLTPNLLGLYGDVLAEDGNPYPFAKRQYAVLLQAAKTKDVVVTIPAGAPVGTRYPLLERTGSLTNNGGAAPGGMLRILEVTPGEYAGGGSSDPKKESRRPAVKRTEKP